MANQQEIAKKVNGGRILTVFDFMKDKRDLLADALPKHITADRLVGMFTMVINTNPELLQCSQASLIGAIVQTAQLGLMPGNINQCYYVPFNNKKKDGSVVKEVQFILSYRGMIELVNRSGKAAILAAECVHENDQWHYQQGLNPELDHIPAETNRGRVIGAYCIAKDSVIGEKLFVFLNREEIDKVRGASRAGQSDYSPWAKWYEEMAKKTAIKRICKLLPLTVDIQKKISTDETIKTVVAEDMTEVKDETNWDEPTPIATPEVPGVSGKEEK